MVFLSKAYVLRPFMMAADQWKQLGHEIRCQNGGADLAVRR